ncbi:hypothetical protein AYI69_g9788 [Smittium culicis]|uniref:CCHC-type domain-containing protein n=1 Tax=Smittium culicis TaxID=133412 RepID=A0A1R1XAA7_9FUNG|nr:hypothetical protein AYI69_g9788 [Smittium culicis]
MSTPNLPSKPTLGLRALEPQCFSGKEDEDAERWLKRYECFRKTCNWSESEAIEYLDLFLEGKALMWYKGNAVTDVKWTDLKSKFKATFSNEEEEYKAWNDLISYSTAKKDSIEITGNLSRLFQRANVTDAKEKLRFLLRSMNPKQKRKVLEAEAKTWESAMLIVAKEEKLEREVNSKPHNNQDSRSFVKEQDPLEVLIKKFDELSVNLLNKESRVLNPVSEINSKNNWYQNRSYDKCNICSRNGHRSEQCSHKRSTTSESNSKTTDNNYKNSVRSQEVSCLDIEVDEFVENDCFAAEKRTNSTESTEKNKRTKMFVSPPSDLAPRPRIQERKPLEIKLSESTQPYSISKNLSDTKADLSISQLLQVAPSIRKELMGLCRKVEVKEVNEVDFGEHNNTNCRGLVTIFNKKYWAVLDTGTACSVISDKLLKELGLEVDNNSDQVIVTADGTRHNTMGTDKQADIDPRYRLVQ